MQRLSLGLLSLFLVACVSSPAGPPAEVAANLVSFLDEGATADASDLMEQVSRKNGYFERIYPVLFEAARERYGAGDPAGAARILRLMSNSYPKAMAVREALIYSLFMQRAAIDKPDLVLTNELEETLAEFAAQAGVQSAWFDLIGTQAAIDAGKLDEARESLLRFLDAWDGEPASLLTYVEDLERYLRSH